MRKLLIPLKLPEFLIGAICLKKNFFTTNYKFELNSQIKFLILLKNKATLYRSI